MRLINTETEAALLEAARLSRQLAGRYRHAIEHLVGEGALKTLLDQRAGELEKQAKRLDDLTRSRDLLPREANTELNDLHQIADQLSGWLDSDQAHALAQRFAKEEQGLLEELATAGKDQSLAQPLESMSQSARRIVDQLTEIG